MVDGISVLRSPEPAYKPLNLAENNALPEHGDHPTDDVHDASTPGVMRTKRRSCGNGSRVLSESRKAVGRARDEVDSMDPYMVREVLSLQVAQSVLHMGMTVVGGMVKEGLLSEKDSEEFFISFDKDKYEVAEVPVLRPEVNSEVEQVEVRVVENKLIGKGEALFTGYYAGDVYRDFKNVDPERLKNSFKRRLSKGSNKFIVENIDIANILK